MLPAMPIEGDEIELRPLRREEYYRLGELGYFDNERVELLDGVIIKMSPMSPPHGWLGALLNELLVKAIPPHLIVRCQSSFALSDVSEPEPDLAVVDRQKFLKAGRPWDHPSHAQLIVELAATSLKKDLGLKARLYAKGGVADYWVVDLDKLEIIVHREPSGSSFKSVQRFDRCARVQALFVPEVSVCLEDLVGD